MVLFKAAALTASFLIPGWGFLAALRPRLREEEYPFFLAASGAGLNAMVALGLGLAGKFHLGTHLAAMATLTALLFALGRRGMAEPLRVSRASWSLSLAAVLVALLLSLPPGRTVFGWSDVGVYPCIAAYLERVGSVHLEVSTVREVAPERRDMVYSFEYARDRPFQAHENKAYFITDFSRGEVVPRFYYLWPSFMALFAAFLGRENMFYAVTGAAVLSLWGFYLLARRLLGERVGLAAGTLLALSPLFTYFSKYTTSEMMNLFLLMAASLAVCAWLGPGGAARDEDGLRAGTREAAASAFFVSLCFLCRLDFILFLVPLLLFALGRRLARRMTATDLFYLLFCLGGFGVATLVGWFFSRPYFYETWLTFRGHVRMLLVFLGTALVLGLAADLLRARWSGFWTERRRRVTGQVISLLVWGIAFASFLYLYAIRPGKPSPEAWFGEINPSKGSTYSTQAFLRWGWYLSTLGLVLVYAGFAVWLSCRRPPGSIFLGLVGWAFVLFYSYDLHCTPIHMLTMRRLVPVALPFGLLATGMALKEMEGWSSRLFGKLSRPHFPGRLAAALALFYLVLYFFHASLPAVGLSEGGNQLELCREVAEAAGPGSVVLMDFHLGDLFGPPMRSFFGVENAWLMDNSRLSKGEFGELLRDLGWGEREVYLLWRPSMSGPVPPLTGGVGVEKVGRWWCRELMVEKTFDRRPHRRTLYSYSVELYRFYPAPAVGTGS
jgi:hypothetical protein